MERKLPFALKQVNYTFYIAHGDNEERILTVVVFF